MMVMTRFLYLLTHDDRWRHILMHCSGGGGQGVLITVRGRRPPHPVNAGTEHVRFSPTRRALLTPDAKRRRELVGESHASRVGFIVLLLQ